MSFLVSGQGMEFFEGSFEEALEKARQEDKAVFVDAYTTWCGPCKRMSKYVFTEAKVGEYYNSNFINVKLNMEKEPGMKFKLKYPVSAYPTLYYIDPDGNVLYTTKGGRKPQQFIDLGKQALLKYDRTGEFKTLYDKGDRSHETVYNYIKALNKSGKSSLKIANEYLNGQKDLTTKENLQIIFESMTELDSRIYNLFDDNKDKIIALVGKEEYTAKVQKAADKTVAKAIEYNTPKLLEEAQKKYKSHIPGKAKEFSINSSMDFSSATKNGGEYVKCAKKYHKKFAKDAASKNDLVERTIKSFKTDKKVMKWVSGVAKTAADQGGLAKYHLNHAYSLYYAGDKAKSLPVAEKALQLAKDQKSKVVGPAQNLVDQLTS